MKVKLNGCSKTIICVMLLTLVLNVVAWNSVTFCDFYIQNIFPIWGPVFGLFTELTGKAVGEMMLVIGILLVVLLVLLSVVGIVLFLAGGRIGFHAFYRKYVRAMALIASVVTLVMTLNCFVLYHGNGFRDKYLNEYVLGEREYTTNELARLRDMVVRKANELSKEVKRDENGLVVYNGDFAEEAIRCMQRLGMYYPQLAGYYNTPKVLQASSYFSQQYLEGYYFPFSMEASYNDVMYIINRPSTICHELAHTKGFILEDEANMISFLACINSEDVFFRYSGYLSVLNYIDRDYKKSINNDKSVYSSHVAISSLVKHDNVFLTPEAWKKVEAKAVVKTSAAKKSGKAITQATLKLNGVEDGIASYCNVVGLMMDYYACNSDGPSIYVGKK